MASSDVLNRVYEYVEKNEATFVERLREAVEIPSVSADPEYRPDVLRMIDWTEKQMTALGIECQQIENGVQKLADGTDLKLPPVLFGILGKEPAKKTLLIYGHLDVQPAHISDGWNTDPFEMVEKDGKFFGRGSSDDKGPVIGWLNAIESMQKLNIEIPINIKFVFEAMEESGSEGLDNILEKHKNSFLADVDFTCISDNYWLGKKKPCLTYGLRGVCYYCVEIMAPKQDLHSGVYGGTVFEPMNDLVWILGRLTDLDGTIRVPGLNKLVAPLTEEERQLYNTIDFDLKDFCADIGVEKTTSDCPKQVLMNRWRFPSLSIHGVEGAFSGPGAKTVIPSKVIGKFSIRLVPDMKPEEVHNMVEEYINKLWEERKSPNKFKFVVLQAGPPWITDFNDPHFQAASKALKKVFGVEPDYTREGGSIPVTLTFQNLIGKSVILLPMGACDDMAHSQNEKLDRFNYINGVKTFVTYLLELRNL